MKIILLLLSLVICCFATDLLAAPTNSYTVELARSFSKDLFDLNGVPYLSPMVETVNATSNARFFNSAYVPHKVDKPYYKVSLNGMLGFVSDEKKWYSPQFPTEQFDINKVGKYVTINMFDPSKSLIRDTAGLINYLFKTILYDGVTSGKLKAPARASTLLGADTTQLRLDNQVLKDLLKSNALFKLVPANLQDSLLAVMGAVPNFYTLPAGGNISTLIAGVPQFEIGSFMGTELLIRVIPPVNLGEYIGDFSFWGLGLKHSISQYFFDEDKFDEPAEIRTPDYNNYANRKNPAPFDMALQVVYQGTHLANDVGVTNAKLTADATILNVNLEFGKKFDDIIEIYTAVAMDYLSISSKFKYYLPVETQAQLGLLRWAPIDPNNPSLGNKIMPAEPPEYPGDTKPQTTNISLSDKTFKWTIGAAKAIGPMVIYADYSVSQFNIFSFGLEYRF